MTILCGHVFHHLCMREQCDTMSSHDIHHLKCPVCGFELSVVVDSGGDCVVTDATSSGSSQADAGGAAGTARPTGKAKSKAEASGAAGK